MAERGDGGRVTDLSGMNLSASYRITQGNGQGSSWFGPLNPMPPVAPPEVAGRLTDYQPGFNLILNPRQGEPIGFAELRALADGYDILRLAIETRKDQVVRQPWVLRGRAGA